MAQVPQHDTGDSEDDGSYRDRRLAAKMADRAHGCGTVINSTRAARPLDKRWRHREAERLAVVRSMTRSNFVEARRMRVCYPSRPSARMVSCTFGLAPIRAMYALMFGHFARSILWILVQLSTVNR